MWRRMRSGRRTAVLAALLVFSSAELAAAVDRAELAAESRRALDRLYATTPAARALGAKAAGILVLPAIIKGGFMVAAQYGNGILFRDGAVAGAYNSTAASFGFQAGAQKFGYALFFIDKAALKYLDKTEGWEIGSGPSLTVVDEGFARNFSTTTLRSDVYAFFFSQKGLMGGIAIQGSKITRLTDES